MKVHKFSITLIITLTLTVTMFSVANTDSHSQRVPSSGITMNNRLIEKQGLVVDQLTFSHSQGQAIFEPSEDDPKGMDIELTQTAISRNQNTASEFQFFPTAWPSGQFVIWKIFLMDTRKTGNIKATCDAISEVSDLALPVLRVQVPHLKIHFELNGRPVAFKLKSSSQTEYQAMGSERSAVCQ